MQAANPYQSQESVTKSRTKALSTRRGKTPLSLRQNASIGPTIETNKSQRMSPASKVRSGRKRLVHKVVNAKHHTSTLD